MRLTSLLLLAVLGTATAFGDGRQIVDDLHIPGAVLYGPDSLLYIAEWGASRVCRYTDSGVRELVTDLVGRPSGLAFGEGGILYIASYDRGVIYALKPGAPGKPEPIAEGFNVPAGLTWADGSLYVANRDAGQIVRLTPDRSSWSRQTVAAGLVQPVAVWRRSDSGLVVSSLTSGLSKVDGEGQISALAPTVQGSGINLVPDGADAFWVSILNEGTVEHITMAGVRTVVARGFSTPLGLARKGPQELVVATWGEGAAFVLPVGR